MTMSDRSSRLLSVVIPTYNEVANIVTLVDRVLEAGGGLEILVVDDASPDGTAEAVRGRFSDHPQVKLIVRNSDRGLANSIRAGLEAAKGDSLLVMDSDFNHDPLLIPVMRAQLEYYELVVGSRFVAGGGMEDIFRYYCSDFYNVLIRLLLGTRLQDNLSGFFAIRREALERLDFGRIFFGYGDYFFRLLAQAADLRLSVIEVPVFYALRTQGESKTNFGRVLTLYTKELLALVAAQGIKHRRPIPPPRRNGGG